MILLCIHDFISTVESRWFVVLFLPFQMFNNLEKKKPMRAFQNSSFTKNSVLTITDHSIYTCFRS